SNIVCAADAAFEHPAAPYRHVVLLSKCLDRFCLRESADPTELDIDNTTGAQLMRMTRVRQTENRLIETKRRPQLSLQLAVVHEIAGRERLLDHQQVVIVESFE